MSIRMLKDPRSPHELFDDLESVYWTMLYGALHRFRHSQKIDMDMFSQASFRKEGVFSGGNDKLLALLMMNSLLTFECRPLKALFVSLSKTLYAYYTALFDLAYVEECAALDAGHKDSDPTREAQAAVDFHYQKLSKPSFWREQLRRALSLENWIDNDVVKEDWYKKQTQEEATQKFKFVSRTSYA
jgi:hypothetical protein